MANENLAKVLQFRDATRTQAKACIVIEGLSGKGKSGLALLMGYMLADKDWTKEFAVDTENKSLDLYTGLRLNTGETVAPFKKVDLLPSHGYAPSNYLLCKENAINAGAKVIINDSITHMWQMAGGVLQQVTALEQANKNVNKYTAWGQKAIIEEKNAIYDVVRDSRIHVISTVRIKEKHEVVKDADGKTAIQSLGEQEIFMPDFKYEPDLVLRMVSPGSAKGTPPAAEVIKTRYAIFEVGETYSFTEDLLGQLKAYLEEGADPAELLEAQRLELVKVANEILNSNPSKATMFPILKKDFGLEDMKLADMTLDQVRMILGILVN
jgi:hypothetical protein